VAAAFLGATTRLTVRLPEGTEVKADLPTETAAALPIGSRAALALPERPVLVDHRRVP
jgi:putative spermidine/putrescine transport system ATP-binding protein